MKKIIQSIAPIAKEAHALKINSPKDMASASELLSRLNKVKDAAQKEKEKVTRPLLDKLAAERARWSEGEKLIAAAIGVVRGAMTEYQTEAEALASAQAAQVAKQLTDGSTSLEDAVTAIDLLERPDAKIQTASGSVSFIEVPCFEVEDMEKLPIAYHIPDLVKIRVKMKAGRELSGVRYWIEKRPKNLR